MIKFFTKFWTTRYGWQQIGLIVITIISLTDFKSLWSMSVSMWIVAFLTFYFDAWKKYKNK